MRNAVSNKGEPRKILGGKNLTVARATFATVWIRACVALSRRVVASRCRVALSNHSCAAIHISQTRFRAKNFAAVESRSSHTGRESTTRSTRFFSFLKLIEQPMKANFERYVDRITQNVITF